MCNQIPASTASAGYTCPKCSGLILPPANAASRVSQGVRETFKNSAWAKRLLQHASVAPISTSGLDAGKKSFSSKSDSSVTIPLSPLRSSSRPALSSTSTVSIQMEQMMPARQAAEFSSRHGHVDPDADKYQRRQSRLLSSSNFMGQILRSLLVIPTFLMQRKKQVALFLLIFGVFFLLSVGIFVRPSRQFTEDIKEATYPDTETVK